MAAHGVPAALLQSISPQALVIYLFFFLLLLFMLRHSARSSPAPARKLVPCRRLPPSPPRRLPVIGHLHLLGSNPHVSLAALSRKHAGGGGLMLLDLGQVRTLVVSTPRATEAVARTHDHVFASRPPSAVADILLGGASDVALAPYGEYWRQARKLVTTHLLSAAKVRSLRAAREEEASLVVAKVWEAARGTAVVVNMTNLLSTYANDVMCRAVSGRRKNKNKKAGRNEVFKQLIAGNAAAFAGNSVDDFFPCLAKVGLLRRVVTAKASRLKKRWDDLLDEIIDEHQDDNDHDGHKQQQDFVDVLLSLQQDYNLTRDNVRVILMDMFAAGTDTSYIVLECAMAELIRKPHVMAKLQAEVRKKTTTTTFREEDLGGMAYLQAVIKETLRLHPPAPLLLPRLSMADCDVDGYTIPAGTRVIINAWALGRDPESWREDDPEEFIPERFIIDDGGGGDLRGKDFRFLPFGAGRRMCPGMNFGLATVELMLAKLVHGFDWELPEGMREEDVDMSEVFGLTVRRKEKLLLVPRPRRDERTYIHDDIIN